MSKPRSPLAGRAHLLFFVALAGALEALLYLAASNAALTLTQYGAMALVTLFLAGLCLWILRWE